MPDDPPPPSCCASEARFGIQSVEVATRLLGALLDAGAAQRLTDLARRSGMPPAKAHRYLVSLTRGGLAMQEPTTGLYDLGPLALRIGLHGIARFEPMRLAERTLADLAEEVGESCALSVWAGRSPAIIRVVEARHSLAGRVPIGHGCPLTWSATGLVFAAFEAPDRTDALLREELSQNRRVGRPGAPRDGSALAARLATVRGAGVGFVDGGEGGAAAVAAPVRDASGALAMVQTVFGHRGRLDVEPAGPLAGLVLSTATRLSASLSAVAGSAPASRPVALATSTRRGRVGRAAADTR